MNEINDNKKAMSEDVKQALIRFNHMVLCMVDACTHLRI